MKYMGSKRRIAKHILPIILKDRKQGQWYYEPFVGGANIIDKVDGNRIGTDNNWYLISLLTELQKGWQPPKELTEQEYKDIKNNKNDHAPELVGYVGISCSFSAKWFGGYRRSHKEKRDYIDEAFRNCTKQNLKGIIFSHRPYDKVIFHPESIIYCDPPYAKTTKDKSDFDHRRFWKWCREVSNFGHTVYISEYEAPSDFECVWEKEQTTTVNIDNYKKATERLFVYNDRI